MTTADLQPRRRCSVHRLVRRKRAGRPMRAVTDDYGRSPAEAVPAEYDPQTAALVLRKPLGQPEDGGVGHADEDGHG